MFRTVLIKRGSKLQYIKGYLVVYDGEEERKVYLKDVTCLIIESTSSLITIPLLIQLVKNNISVIFCDEKHNPTGTVLGLSNHFQNSGNIYKQINWNPNITKLLWKEIVKLKINMQLQVLNMFEKTNIELLESYTLEVEDNDITNREGLAAKVYFFSLFGQEFNRKEQSVINDLLNYGYSIILSCFNREIVQAGYLTQLGIFHRGKSNPFNLSCDFMEPFRPIIDVLAFISVNHKEPIKEMRKILTKKVIINNERRYIDDAIRIFVSIMLRILNGEDVNIPNIVLKSKEHYFND
jgi:CRISPR-associated protein Cas1